MAISTFTDLKSAIASWTWRPDALPYAPNFIALAEARINRELGSRGQETETTLVTVPGSRFVSLPAGFREPLNLWLRESDPREELPQFTASFLPINSGTAAPSYWAIDGARIAFDVVADQAYPFDFRFLGDLALSDDQPTNATLTRHPDLYLWASLVEAYTFFKDQGNAQMAEGRFQQALQDAKNSESASYQVPLRTELVMAETFDIVRGY